MAVPYSLTRAAERESLGQFRKFIDELCRLHDIDEESCYALKLAVDEACTNVVEHGYRGMEPGTITVEVLAGDDNVEVRITDAGRPFPPGGAAVPDTSLPLEEREAGGLGIFFIRELMDTVDYRTGQDGNTLIIGKRLHPAPPGPKI